MELAIGVEGDDKICSVLCGVIDPCLEGGALAEIVGVLEKDGFTTFDFLGGLVLRTIIDNNYLIHEFFYLFYGLVNPLFFIVSRDDSEDLRAFGE